MKKKILFFINLFLTISFVVYFFIKILDRYMLGNSPYVKKISIYSDDKNVNELVLVLSINNKTKIDSLNLKDLNNKISEIRDIKKSSVRKLSNNSILLKIEKYKPIALWADGKDYFIISSEGKVIYKYKKMEKKFIVIKGKIPEDIVSINLELKGLVDKVDYVSWIEDRRWDIHLKNGLIIKLPEKEPYKRLRSFITLNNLNDLFSKNIEFIDLRNENIIVKMK